MADKKLDGCRVAILAADYFEEPELLDTRKALDEAGAKTTVIAPHDGEIQAVRPDIEKTQKVKVDMTLDQAQPQQFDAVLLPGGTLNADRLRVNPKAQQFLQQMDREGKPIAVICHGPWLLVSSGLVKGRHMTSYQTLAVDLTNAGAKWVDEACVRDGNFVSSRKPSDIPQFNENMIQLFSESKQRKLQAA